jgi:glycosyltransferase involved in cell wall biosynthesis
MKKENNDLIDVVIPCYKCAPTLRKTVLSVLDQTYAYIEIVLVCRDDQGDESLNVAKDLAKEFSDRQIKIIVEKAENLGPGYSRNLGIESSDATYIAFLDSDDYYVAKDKLEKDVELLEREHADLVCSNFSSMKNGKKPFTRLSLKPFLLHDKIMTSTVLLRRETSQSFDPELYRYGEDYLFFAKMLSDKRVVVKREAQTTFYTTNPNMAKSKLHTYHQGERKAIKILRKEKRISWLYAKFVLAFQTLKYWRRLLRSR